MPAVLSSHGIYYLCEKFITKIELMMKKLFSLMSACLLTLGFASCRHSGATNEANNASEYANPTIQTIMERRSIRDFKQEPIAREQLDLIMECGINAPNGQNKQSWAVRVVDNPAVFDSIVNMTIAANPDVDPEMVRGCYRGAPVMVYIAREKSYDFSTIDCGLLSENICLAAQSLGIGSICLGSPIRMLQKVGGIADMLQLDENYELVLCIGLGYPNESPEAKPRDKSKVRYIEI